MIASGLHFRNYKMPQSRKRITSTPFVLKLHRGIGGYDAVEVHKRYGFCGLHKPKFRMPSSLDFKAWQFAIRDFFRMVLSCFMVTLFAQNNAILSFQSPAFGYRYAGDGVGFSEANILTTLGTPNPPSILFVLPNLSLGSSPKREKHNVLLPFLCLVSRTALMMKGVRRLTTSEYSFLISGLVFLGGGHVRIG